MAGRLRQAEARHVAVDALVLPGSDQVSLVPDADPGVAGARAVEPLPRLEVRLGWAAREAVEVFGRAPVLDQAQAARVEEVLVAEQAAVRVLLQRLQHPWHGREDGPPLADRPELVEAHPDQE